MKIKDNLMKYTKDDLVQIAKDIEFKGYSKLKKAEFAQGLADKLSKAEMIEKVYKTLDSDAVDVLKRLDSGEKLDYIFGIRIAKFSFFGYIAADEKKNTISLCDDVKEIVHKLCTESCSSESDSDSRIDKYASAAVKLYGVISLNRLYEIYSIYYPGQNKEDFMNDIKSAAGTENKWTLSENDIAAADIVNTDDYDKLAKRSELKKLYIPNTVNEFMSYAASGYANNTESYINLKDYLLRMNIIGANKVDDVCGEIVSMCEESIEVADIMNMFYRKGFTFRTYREEQNVQQLVRTLYNNVRRPSDGGFSLTELYNMNGGRQRMFIPSVDYKKNKIGRNDPCPCGSGKKYKKCCGR